MTKSALKPNKIVVLTGAGISAPSGLATFRDPNGIWSRYRIEDVATPEAWARNPAAVLAFYNERRAQAAAALPNAAHRALANLESKYEVVVITQNVDDLHERGGSTRVIHVHGELTKARSTADDSLVVTIGAAPIRLGDRCAKGSQLRPHIVWFGEMVQHLDVAADEIRTAARVLVIGTSLQVYPAAGVIHDAPYAAEKVLVDVSGEHAPPGFKLLRGSADQVVPPLVADWLARG